AAPGDLVSNGVGEAALDDPPGHPLRHPVLRVAGRPLDGLSDSRWRNGGFVGAGGWLRHRGQAWRLGHAARGLTVRRVPREFGGHAPGVRRQSMHVPAMRTADLLARRLVWHLQSRLAMRTAKVDHDAPRRVLGPFRERFRYSPSRSITMTTACSAGPAPS